MPNCVSRNISNDLYIAAAFLVVFGSGSTRGGRPTGMPVLLAVICLGAAYYVRGGTPGGRVAGLVASGSTAAYGVLTLWGGNGVVVGMFAAIVAFIHLLGRGEAFADQSVAGYGLAAARPPTSQQWTPQVGVIGSGSPPYAAAWSQPYYGAPPPISSAATPAVESAPQWTPAELQQRFAPPAAEPFAPEPPQHLRAPTPQ
ncbi:MAG: hypothetical protein ABIM89_05910 [Mycobacteriales bacterium]